MKSNSISPSRQGYGGVSGVNMNANTYGQPSNADVNNRMQEPIQEESASCAKCGQHSNELLILTCNHNLCLRCARNNLIAQNEKSKQGKNGAMHGQNNQFQTVVCALCQMATILDPDCAAELLAMNHGPEINLGQFDEQLETTGRNHGTETQQSEKQIFQGNNQVVAGRRTEQQNVTQNGTPGNGVVTNNVTLGNEQQFSNKKVNQGQVTQNQKIGQVAVNRFNQAGANQTDVHATGRTRQQSQVFASNFNESAIDINSQASSRFNLNQRAPALQNVSRNSPLKEKQNTRNGAPSVSTFSYMPTEGQPCPQHPDEIVSYYCFTCQCPPICAECVIHGEHRGHQVQTIRKAHPILYKEVEKLLQKVNKKSEDMLTQVNRLESRKRDLAEHTRNQKLQIAGHFEQIRQAMDAREREIIERIDKVGLKQQSDVETCVRMVQSRVQHLKENEHSIASQLPQGDELQFITFYAERFRALTEQVNTESDIMPDIKDIEHQTDTRQASCDHALQGFQTDVNIVQENLKMLEFDAPQVDQKPEGQQSVSRNYGGIYGKANNSFSQASPAHATSQSFSNLYNGRKDVPAPPVFSYKPQQSRLQSFSQNPGTQSNFAQQYFNNTSLGGAPNYNLRSTSSFAAIESPQHYSQQYYQGNGTSEARHYQTAAMEYGSSGQGLAGGQLSKSTNNLNAPVNMENMQNVVQNTHQLVDNIVKQRSLSKESIRQRPKYDFRSTYMRQSSSYHTGTSSQHLEKNVVSGQHNVVLCTDQQSSPYPPVSSTEPMTKHLERQNQKRFNKSHEGTAPAAETHHMPSAHLVSQQNSQYALLNMQRVQVPETVVSQFNDQKMGNDDVISEEGRGGDKGQIQGGDVLADA